MAARMSFKDNRNKTNTHGVTVPVRPQKVSDVDSFETRLKRVTTKHQKAIASLAKR